MDLKRIKDSLSPSLADDFESELTRLVTLAQKHLGEVHMGAEPPRYSKALQSFVKAVPMLAAVVENPPMPDHSCSQNDSGWEESPGPLLSSDTINELLTVRIRSTQPAV